MRSRGSRRVCLASGRAAGAAREANETPREYALRLAATFPGTAGRAAFIAQEVEKEVYGGAAADSDPSVAAQLRELRRQLRTRAFLAERLFKLGVFNSQRVAKD